MFSNEEYADMHFLNGFCGGNEYQAAEKYKWRYPKRRGPDICVFGRSNRCLRETGSFPKHTAERQLTLNKQDEVMDIYKCSTNIKCCWYQQNESLEDTAWKQIIPIPFPKSTCLVIVRLSGSNGVLSMASRTPWTIRQHTLYRWVHIHQRKYN